MSVKGDLSPLLLDQYRAERATLRELARAHGVSITTMWRKLRDRGISRGSGRGRPADKEIRATVFRLATQGRSRRQIADALGVTPEWVRCLLADHGLSVSLQILTCPRCGKAVASGHKAEKNPHVLCVACLREQPELPFTARLKTYRLAAQLSRAQLSAKCGLSRAVLGNYERGEDRPSRKSARKLAAALHVSVPALMGRAVVD